MLCMASLCTGPPDRNAALTLFTVTFACTQHDDSRFELNFFYLWSKFKCIELWGMGSVQTLGNNRHAQILHFSVNKYVQQSLSNISKHEGAARALIILHTYVKARLAKCTLDSWNLRYTLVAA